MIDHLEKKEEKNL